MSYLSVHLIFLKKEEVFTSLIKHNKISINKKELKA